MKKQIMQVKILNQIVQADTDGFVDLNSLSRAGNAWRLENEMAIYQISTFLSSKLLEEYTIAAAEVWGLPKTSFLKKSGKNRTSTTLGHVSIAVLLAEQISPIFHATVHKVFIDGKLLENRLYGGEEFKRFNEALLDYLPSERGNDNARRINAAKLIRAQCELTKPENEEIETWNQEAADSVAQEHRVEILEKLTSFLRLGFVKDWDHLKEIIIKL